MSDTSRHSDALIELTICSVYLYRQNLKKEREGSGDETNSVSFSDFQDLTDKEHPQFRYVY